MESRRHIIAKIFNNKPTVKKQEVTIESTASSDLLQEFDESLSGVGGKLIHLKDMVPMLIKKLK